MIHENMVKESINRIIYEISSKQSPNGAWHFCFEGTVMTDAYMIILIRSLSITTEEDLVRVLVHRLFNKQNRNGAWKAYEDEHNGNLSATIEAYFALLYSGYTNDEDERIQKAEMFIVKHGGLRKAELLTRIMLSLTKQAPWPSIVKSIPIEIMLLPKNSPFNIFQFVGYARVHWMPILVCSNHNFHIAHKHTPDISHLNDYRDIRDERILSNSRFLHPQLKQELNKLLDLPQTLLEKSMKKAEDFMTKRIEPNGTLYSYFSSSFFMIFALLALGYDKKHPIISKAIQGMKSFLYVTNTSYHIQNSPSTVWDTALLSSALQNAGVPPEHEVIQRSIHYLLSRQQSKLGDWSIKNPMAAPGGWGFSDINTIVPDVDDTTAALRSLTRFAHYNEPVRNSWTKGLDWLLSMQNDDGGWSAFEKNTENMLFSLLPFRYEDRVLFDPSTADITGRTLYFLGTYTNIPRRSKSIQHATKWLLANQERNGSWYGRWGICYIYGTWAAITGLKTIGTPSSHPSIQKAVHWLLSIQNEDGGWGESCKSDLKKKYVPLNASTPSQTAWALDALISALDTPTSKMEEGISSLINSLFSNDWRTSYPTGAGIPGSYYIRYHSYHFIWPLQALSHYRDKYL
ncbi:MAG: squalene--hopene cyclase [Bacillaceae bacterium]|nr:squalene--hopene cyclase [Bacillaceae bacterium]